MTILNLHNVIDSLQANWYESNLIDHENSWWCDDIKMEFIEEYLSNLGYTQEQIDYIEPMIDLSGAA